MHERAPSTTTDDLTVIGPAIVGAVRDAVRDALETPDPASIELRPALSALVERSRAYRFPPERVIVVLKRILSEEDVVSDLYMPWPGSTSRTTEAYRRAVQICIDEYYRQYPWEVPQPPLLEHSPAGDVHAV